jgi:23S rRNA pseudouridine1911/1915/1917 synthase
LNIEIYTVPEGSRRQRADKALSTAFPAHSRVAFQRAFAAGLVKLKGSVIGQKETVLSGDEISFSFPEVIASDLTAKKIPLDILYEDKHLLVVNKPVGMVVHPGAGTREDTLVHALLAHCKGTLSGVGGVERPGIVHRLDRETSGAMVVAKNDEAHRSLAEQFANRSVDKEYFALVLGVPNLLSGSIRKNIGRDVHHRHRMMAFEAGSAGGRTSRTDWVLVEKFGKLAALVRCILFTGRTHQIRVHLKSSGHVLLGDLVYGFKQRENLPKIPRVMLHSEHLKFVHPKTGKIVDIKAPLPKDFQKVIKALRSS